MPSKETQHEAPQIKPRHSALIGCMVLILVSGIGHGYLSGRWTQAATKQNISETLSNLPTRCGDWQMQSKNELDQQTQRILECYGSMVREYVNEFTGKTVNVFVVSGPRGPIAVHTPEVCYSSSGSEPAGTREAVQITNGDETDTLWKVQFQTPGEKQPIDFEVWYGWSDGGCWQAANFPRAWLTDSLYKIQAAGPPAASGEEISPVEDFLQQFLPVLNQAALKRQMSSTPVAGD